MFLKLNCIFRHLTELRWNFLIFNFFFICHMFVIGYFMHSDSRDKYSQMYNIHWEIVLQCLIFIHLIEIFNHYLNWFDSKQLQVWWIIQTLQELKPLRSVEKPSNFYSNHFDLVTVITQTGWCSQFAFIIGIVNVGGWRWIEAYNWFTNWASTSETLGIFHLNRKEGLFLQERN